MRPKILSGFISVFLLSIGVQVLSQATTPLGRESRKLVDLILKRHFSAKELDDSTSAYIYKTLLEDLDPGNMILLKEDHDELQPYRYEIDDQITSGTSPFFDLFREKYKVRLGEIREVLDQLEKESFDYKTNEVVDLEGDQINGIPTDKSERFEQWRLWMKYHTLDEIFEYNYVDSVLTADVDSIIVHTDEAKAMIIDAERFSIKTFLEHPAGYEKYIERYYLDAIARAFDPHTKYFSPIQKNEFEQDLSRGNERFGFSVDEGEDGKPEIISLIPGSPAWNCNQINVGDKVLKVEFGDGKNIDMRQKTLEDLRILFKATSSEEVTLTLRKLDGTIEDVELVKGEVYVEEDNIKNLLLKGEKTVGYITLPDFYTDWNDEGSLGCANDVAKVIVKLQEEKMEGLILDFRFNGGGSVLEAIDLAGIFINWGPICVFNNKLGDPTTVKDMNKGSIYNGPLVILVNGFSASATEIFTAAMQDYNRAIVVGSQTYGKATGQVVLPIDPYNESTGFVKVTTSKYYRITKATHQLSGVEPNIPITDIYSVYDYREANYDNALPPDSVDKKVYYTSLSELPNSALKTNSEKRQLAHPELIAVRNLLDTIKTTSIDKGMVSLNVLEFQKQQKEYQDLIDRIFGDQKYRTDRYTAENNKYDKKIMELNKYRARLNTEYLQEIESDLYIEEAYNIITDYIKLKN